MKFISTRNIKFVVIFFIFLTLISLSLSTNAEKLNIKNLTIESNINNQQCLINQEKRLQDENRDDLTRKLLFFVLLGYFYSVYF